MSSSSARLPPTIQSSVSKDELIFSSSSALLVTENSNNRRCDGNDDDNDEERGGGGGIGTPNSNSYCDNGGKANPNPSYSNNQRQQQHPAVPVPIGSAAEHLVGLFVPPPGTGGTNPPPLNRVNEAYADSSLRSVDDTGGLNDRPSTPPPTSPTHRAARYDDDDEQPCPPPSPGYNSGLTWRKAGSTFNLHPTTLVSSSGKWNANRRFTKLEHLDNLPRLVLRNRAFHQSSNKVHIRHNQGPGIYKLLRYNWFHVFLRWPTKWSLLFLMSVWTGAILFFAAIYVAQDALDPASNCGLGEGNQVIHFAGAFAFSLETCTTVGYGLPNGVNSYFERGCPGLQIIIYFQMAWSLLFNAFLITFVYNRLGRSETRSTQVVFSNKALVSIVDGQVRFQVRLFDLDAKHPVVEAHVRFYGIMKHRPVPRPLRILQPDDELGAMLFLSFPSVVSHSIDMYSLLHPPVATMLMEPKGLVLRQVDGMTANRDDVVCPICGESYGTFENWCNHARYQQVVEEKDGYPIEHTHLSLDMNEIENEPFTKPVKDLKELQQYFQANVSEILCVVEGIDPMQSGTFQALQSYRYEDIEWKPHYQFSPCLEVTPFKDRVFTVDFERYHDVVPDPEAEAKAAAREDAARADAAISKAEQGGVAAGSSSTAQRAKAVINKPVRKRHRRIKTLSNRTSDSLFTSNNNPINAINVITRSTERDSHVEKTPPVLPPL